MGSGGFAKCNITGTGGGTARRAVGGVRRHADADLRRLGREATKALYGVRAPGGTGDTAGRPDPVSELLQGAAEIAAVTSLAKAGGYALTAKFGGAESGKGVDALVKSPKRAGALAAGRSQRCPVMPQSRPLEARIGRASV